MRESLLQGAGSRLVAQFLQRHRLGKCKGASRDTAQARQVSTTAQDLSQVMGHGADVASGGDADGELRIFALERADDKVLNHQGYGFQHYRLPAPCCLVGRFAIDFLGGERGRGLVYLSSKKSGCGLDVIVGRQWDAQFSRRRRDSVCVVGVGGKAERMAPV